MFLNSLYQKIYFFIDKCYSLYCTHREEKLKRKILKNFCYFPDEKTNSQKQIE